MLADLLRLRDAIDAALAALVPLSAVLAAWQGAESAPEPAGVSGAWEWRVVA